MPVRLSPEMLDLLDFYCGSAGCSRSDVVREAMMLWTRTNRDALIKAGAEQTKVDQLAYRPAS